MSSELNKDELERYSRHIILPEFGIEGQRKLKAASVLVVGTGGLGAPLLQYLTAAGVGKIGLVDFDVVDESNLQRQVLFTVDDVGLPKVEAARERLEAQNPHVEFEVFNERLTSENALEIIKDYDVVADGTDNFATRYLVNDACVLLDKVNVYASIFKFGGQASVFNYLHEDGSRGPNYRDLFPSPPPPGLVPSCAEGGVIGVLRGIVGSFQANEVIKVITGIGKPLAGRLFLFDALNFESRTLKVPNQNASAEIKELIDYEEFCGVGNMQDVQSISVEEFVALQASGEEFQLIDVREAHEYHQGNLGGQHIPIAQIDSSIAQISKEKKVVFHCKSGLRGIQAINNVLAKEKFDNLYNLEGGMVAYSNQIDNSAVI